MPKDQASHTSPFSFVVFSLLILSGAASVVVIAQRGFDPPAACDEYSAADTHSPRLSLLLHANVASLSFHRHDTSVGFFFSCFLEKGGSRDDRDESLPRLPRRARRGAGGGKH